MKEKAKFTKTGIVKNVRILKNKTAFFQLEDDSCFKMKKNTIINKDCVGKKITFEKEQDIASHCFCKKIISII
jgi:hypothetical protein